MCGYTKDQQTPHGFRSTASTLLNEQVWRGDAIERQLAYGEPDKVRGSYNSAEHLPLRRSNSQRQLTDRIRQLMAVAVPLSWASLNWSSCNSKKTFADLITPARMLCLFLVFLGTALVSIL